MSDEKNMEENLFKFDDGELSSPRESKESEDSVNASPRDKKQKVSAEEPANLKSPNKSSNPLFVPASPPKFVSFEEIMQAANGVSNMVLAHEIAVDNDFRFNQQKLPEKSIEKQVTDIMKRAFWDALQEKLNEDPPDYTHGLVLLQEVKETLEGVLLPQHLKLKAEINEIIDLDLIKQKAEHGALNFQYYADFVLSMMSKMCSPVRDEKIAELKQIKDVVPLFQGIFDLLELMKMDMANFTIQQIRPYIQQQSVDYEKKKFKEFLKQSEENNIDGLQYTKSWLERHGLDLYYKTRRQESASSSNIGTNTAGASKDSPNPQAPLLSPLNIMNTAYLELLNWPSNQGYPEVVLMDQKRFLDLEQKVKWLTLISSILLVTYNTVGGAIAGIKDLKEKLKDRISIILKDVQEKDLDDAMKNVAVQVEKEVNDCLVHHGYSKLEEKRREMLQGQILEVKNIEHPVHTLMRSRVDAFIKDLLVGKKSSEVKIPAGFSAVTEELKHVCGQFLRLVSHNRQVFGEFYADIIGSIIKKYENDMSENEGTPV